MRVAVQGTPFPGYPEPWARLYIPASELQYTIDGRPVFPADPDAPYAVFDHTVDPAKPRPAHAFHDTGGPLPPDEAARITWGNMGTDARGFPLHPYAVDMVTDPNIGAIVGPGYYYHPGLSNTVDLGVTARGVPSEAKDEHGVTLAAQASPDTVAADGLYLSVLTVTRKDTGQRALPGGEIDSGEDALAAALREAYEETGMRFTDADSQGRRLVADPRLTTCTATITELFTIDAGLIPDEKPVGDENEVRAAEWVVADKALLVPRLHFGSHFRMLCEVVASYQDRRGVTVMENGLIIPNANR